MSILQALVLGLVQGIAEFLPISSSGHLILIPYLFHWGAQPLYFDVFLHWGTVIAVLIYFRKEWTELIRSVYQNRKLIYHKTSFVSLPLETRILILIVVGTIPAVIIGFFLQKFFEETFRSAYTVIIMLIVVALLMWSVERKARVVRTFKALRIFDAIIIGLAQAIALVPGTSRSGITIVAGMMRGLSREEAARFSFLLSTPVIIGAGLYETFTILRTGLGEIQYMALLVGFLAATISGLFSIRFLMKFIQNHKLTVFVYYRLGLALILILVLFFWR